LKQLEPLGPDSNVLFEYSAYDAISAGFDKIVFVIQSTSADQFSTVVNDLSGRIRIEFAFQDQFQALGLDWPKRMKPWGTGHALLAAQHLITEPFVLCNADDYYGASAFATAAEFLNSQTRDSTRYGMLGYSLLSTLPGTGSVSRGLCEIAEDGRLSSVVEHRAIIVEDGAIVSENKSGEKIALDESQVVSMNFWLMTPSIFSFLSNEIEKFAKHYLQDTTAEILLPDIIGGLLKNGDVTVDCLPHSERWFGLTHSMDRKKAVSEIKNLHDDEIYPTPLWREADSDL
jgi:UTP-glucose-1-phosphate uridylyltransferase